VSIQNVRILAFDTFDIGASYLRAFFTRSTTPNAAGGSPSTIIGSGQYYKSNQPGHLGTDFEILEMDQNTGGLTELVIGQHYYAVIANDGPEFVDENDNEYTLDWALNSYPQTDRVYKATWDGSALSDLTRVSTDGDNRPLIAMQIIATPEPEGYTVVLALLSIMGALYPRRKRPSL
jgi:hypothetical protein